MRQRLGLCSIKQTFICLLFGFSAVASAQNTPSSPIVISPPANRNSQNTSSQGFAGFYTQVGVGYQAFSPTFSNSVYTVGSTAYGSSADVNSSQSLMGTITAGYNYPVSSSVLIGLGVELSPLQGQSTSVSGATVGNLSIPSTTYQLNNSYNLFASLTFPLDKLTAIYGKIGYSKANVSAGPNLDSLGYSGYSIGAGYKTILTGNWYAYLEANYVNYGKVSNSGSAIIPGSSSYYTYSNNSTANSYNVIYGLGLVF